MKLQFPGPPPKAVFTSSSLSSAREVKDILSAWHRDTEAHGPHRADVDVFAKYAADVAADEKNMEKARRLVSWLDWMVENQPEGRGKQTWRKNIAEIKDAVHKALKTRGLAPMKFG